MRIEWAKKDNMDAYNVIKHQYKRYATACMQAGNSYAELDEVITDGLFPMLVNLILDDLKAGGKHEAKFDEEERQFLLIDNFMFANCSLICTDKAMNTILQIKSRLPLKGKYDIWHESVQLGQLIKDLYIMKAHEFAEKHHISYGSINDFLVKLTSEGTIKNSLSYDDLSAEGTTKWTDVSIDLLQEYVNEFYDEITDETLRRFYAQDGALLLSDINAVNGTLIRSENKMPIDGIGMEYECTRDGKNGKCKLSAFTLIAYSGDNECYISEKTVLEDDITSFGAKIDDSIEEYENFAAWMDENGLSDDE